MCCAAGDFRNISDLLKRQPAPDFRHNHFSLFFSNSRSAFVAASALSSLSAADSNYC
jgi:hypothetical protein